MVKEKKQTLTLTLAKDPAETVFLLIVIENKNG